MTPETENEWSEYINGPHGEDFMAMLDDENTVVFATEALHDEGSLIVFAGYTDDAVVHFACERRAAQAIIEAIEDGAEPPCLVPSYLILRTFDGSDPLS